MKKSNCFVRFKILKKNRYTIINIMKTYKEIIEERYDGVEKDIHVYDNIYSLINPIGYQGDKKLRSVFYTAFNYIRNNGMDISQSNILDIGCGKGTTTRYFSELTGSSDNIYGIDLSEHRIQYATKMNPNISYKIGDIVQSLSYPIMFDIIAALDVFMHLSDEQDILLALNNIKTQLNEHGYFIWYDAYSSDHYKTTQNQDHSGFHPKQMIELAQKAGFKKVFQKNIFKKIFWKFHSLYLINRMPVSLVNFMEHTFPGSPGNMMMIFVKSK